MAIEAACSATEAEKADEPLRRATGSQNDSRSAQVVEFSLINKGYGP